MSHDPYTAPSVRGVGTVIVGAVQANKRPESVPMLGDTFEDRVAQLTDLHKRESPFKQWNRSLLDFYEGDSVKHIPLGPNERWEHAVSTKLRFLPRLLGRVIDQLSYMYARPSERSSETESDDEIWSDLLWDWKDGLDAILLRIDGMSRLCGSVLGILLPAVGETPEDIRRVLSNPANAQLAGLDLHYFTPDQFSAIPHPFAPDRIGAALVRWVVIDKEPVDYYFDDESFAILKGTEVVHSQQHNLGLIPCFPLTNTLELRNIHGLPMGGYDTLSNWRAIGYLITEILHTARLQRGQPVGPPDMKGNLGPDSLMTSDTPELFKFARNEGDTTQMTHALQIALTGLASSYGIPLTTLRIVGAEKVAWHQVSVDKGLQDLAELETDRRKRLAVVKRWERLIRQVAQAYYRQWTGRELSTYDVTFPFIESQLSVFEQKAVIAGRAGDLDNPPQEQDNGGTEPGNPTTSTRTNEPIGTNDRTETD